MTTSRNRARATQPAGTSIRAEAEYWVPDPTATNPRGERRPKLIPGPRPLSRASAYLFYDCRRTDGWGPPLLDRISARRKLRCRDPECARGGGVFSTRTAELRGSPITRGESGTNELMVRADNGRQLHWGSLGLPPARKRGADRRRRSPRAAHRAAGRTLTPVDGRPRRREPPPRASSPPQPAATGTNLRPPGSGGRVARWDHRTRPRGRLDQVPPHGDDVPPTPEAPSTSYFELELGTET